MSASTHRSTATRIGGLLNKSIVPVGRLSRRLSARVADWLLVYMTCRYLTPLAGVPLILGYLVCSVRRFGGATLAQHRLGIKLINSEGAKVLVTQALIRQALTVFLVLWLQYLIAWDNIITWGLFATIMLLNALPLLGTSRRVVLDHLLSLKVIVMAPTTAGSQDVDTDKLASSSWRRVMAVAGDFGMFGTAWALASWPGVAISLVCFIGSLYGQGRTPGDWLCRLQVVDLNGQSLSFKHALGYEFGLKYLLATLVKHYPIKDGPFQDDYRAQRVTTKSLTAATTPTP
jgi:uncharacterized RDD family membrane protein YckC